MLFSTPAKDHYCKFTYNSMTGEHERDWIEYADGTFEPVRRNGHLKQKGDGQPSRFQWWHTTKLADWMPWEHGHSFSWNHDLAHDDEGCLTCVSTDTDWVQEFQYDAQGRRRADHDTARGVLTRTYEYGDDNRLLGAALPDGRIVTYDHDENGQRSMKYVDGQPVEAYLWPLFRGPQIVMNLQGRF